MTGQKDEPDVELLDIHLVHPVILSNILEVCAGKIPS